MGGNFDPPHMGHLTIAEQVKAALSLAEIRMVPNGAITYKENCQGATSKDRLRMVQLAAESVSGVLVDDRESKRQGYTYTYLTLKDLKKQEPDTAFTFVVGADSLDYMDRWVHPEQIFPMARIAVVLRPGFPLEKVLQKQKQLEEEFQADIVLVPMEEIPISSTQIRNRIARGESVKGMIPESVEDYIRQHHLYGG